MTKKNGKTTAETIENAISKTQAFFIKKQKALIYTCAAIVLLVAGYFGVKYMYIEPQQKTASSEMFFAERYFEADSLQMALKGNGQHPGFVDIIENYGLTPAANTAHYYAGMSYLHLGQFEEAIKYLKNFNAKKDPLLYTLTKQSIGDAYLELNQKEEALKYYKEASSKFRNSQTTPMSLLRAALVCEQLGNYADALSFYKDLQTSYPQSQEAADCDKYIARTEAHLNTK